MSAPAAGPLGVAWLPMTPLLVPEVGGAQVVEPIRRLRAACRSALDQLVRLPVATIVALTPAEPAGQGAPGAVWSWHGFGVGSVPLAPVLPWQLGLAAWLLDQAGWTGERRLVGLGGGEDVGVVAEEIAAVAPAALLVLGDGSARRSERAPGHLDERAAAWDETLGAALGSADVAALAGLDPRLGDELMSAAAVSFPVAAGALQRLAPGPWRADLRYDEAPLGVGYQVAIWSS